MAQIAEAVQTESSGTAAPRGAGAGHRARGILRRIVSGVVIAIVLTIAASAVVVSAASHLSSDGEYSIFGHPVMIVLSGSMSPVIHTGDLVIDDHVTATEASHLHVGQIISFQAAPDKVFTHRIVGVVQEKSGTVAYRTKGDANNAPDTTLRPSGTVLGVYSKRVPDGGYILNALHKPVVLIMLILAIILGFSVGPLFRAARKYDVREASPPMA